MVTGIMHFRGGPPPNFGVGDKNGKMREGITSMKFVDLLEYQHTVTSNMALSATNFYSLTLSAPKSPHFALQN